MAWRIQDSVERGEIDNRQPGRVRGRLWMHGFPAPVVLELKGNACGDLAGCFLEFDNPSATIPLRADATFARVQIGTAGDMTASRKVRVPDVPLRQLLRLYKKGFQAPEHTANCLYLEWFSESNGRVVIESTEFKLKISPPAWTLSPSQEQERRQESAQAFTGFLHKLSDAIEASHAEPPENREWDEFDYERLLRESDARADKYMELLDKYRDHPDRERLVAREMGWDFDEPSESGASWRDNTDTASGDPDEVAGRANLPSKRDEFGADEFAPDECEDQATPVNPDPRTEGIDWVRTKDGEIRHPLYLRALHSSVALRKKCSKLRAGACDDDDLWRLLTEFQITAGKLGGALNCLGFGRDVREAALIVACLKRSLGHLHLAQAALAKVAAKSILPPGTLASARKELFAIREEILRLMEEFRDRN